MSTRAPIRLATALALVLGLAACASAPVQTSAPSPLPTESLAPEPAQIPSLDAELAAAKAAQTRETGLTAPAMVYRGNCANLYSDAEVSEIVGVPVVLTPRPAASDIQASALGLRGGIRCFWQDADQTVSYYLVALPEKAVDFYASSDCDLLLADGSFGCELPMAGGWILITGLLTTTRGDLAQLPERGIELFELFGEHVSAGNLALPPKPAAGAWAFPADCESVVADADLASVAGLGAESSGAVAAGADPYYLQGEVALWKGLGPGGCVIAGNTVQVFFTALGGARYNEAAVAGSAGAEPLAVSGLDSVFVTPTASGRHRVDVFDGPNWLQFEVGFVKNAGPIATALVASLDLTATK